MIAFLILTLLYFVYLHGILPQVPFDPSQVVLLWCLKWVLLFFIGLTFARSRRSACTVRYRCPRRWTVLSR